MQMADARRRVSNERMVRIHPQYKNICPNLEIVVNSARCMISLIKVPQCPLRIAITKDNASEMDYLMIQQMVKGRTRNNNGEEE